MPENLRLYASAADPVEPPGGRIVDADVLWRRLLLWNVPGRTSMGLLSVPPGTIQLPDDPTRAKLTWEHDRTAPVAVITALLDDGLGLIIGFKYGTTAAAVEARTEMVEQLRDGLSFDLDDAEADWYIDNPVGQLIRGRLVAVGQVTIPAFAGSGAPIAASTHQQEDSMSSTQRLAASAAPATPVFAAGEPAHRLTATDGANNGSGQAPPAAPAAATTAAAAATGAQSPPVSAAAAATGAQEPPVPEAPAQALTASRAATTRPVSHVEELAKRLIAARWEMGDGGVISTMTAALADVTPSGNGIGNDTAGLAVRALGELWNKRSYQELYSGLVTAERLTSALLMGWRWTVPPEVGPYAGNKADIPTNPATLELVQVKPSRIAGGHDLDRIYIDLGDAGVIASYWRRMTKSCAKELDEARLTESVTAAGAAGAATSIPDAIMQGLAAVPSATYAAVAQDLWAAQMALPATELPAYFTTGNMFGDDRPALKVFPAPGLVGQVLVGDKAALEFHTVEPPIKIEAVVVAKAGVDAGLYSYYAALLTEPADKPKLYTVTPPLPFLAADTDTGTGSKKG
jgi:hypothetical protein